MKQILKVYLVLRKENVLLDGRKTFKIIHAKSTLLGVRIFSL